MAGDVRKVEPSCLTSVSSWTWFGTWRCSASSPKGFFSYSVRLTSMDFLDCPLLVAKTVLDYTSSELFVKRWCLACVLMSSSPKGFRQTPPSLTGLHCADWFTLNINSFQQIEDDIIIHLSRVSLTLWKMWKSPCSGWDRFLSFCWDRRHNWRSWSSSGRLCFSALLQLPVCRLCPLQFWYFY